MRLHSTDTTFAGLVQEGARPELGYWILPHLSQQDRLTATQVKRRRCSLPTDGSSLFLESEQSTASGRAARPVRFVRESHFFAGRSDARDQPPPGLPCEPPR